MKIVHFSDTHASARFSGWRSLFDKRIAGTINYALFRGAKHNQSLLENLHFKIRDLSPDLIVCTGDISSTGEPDEFSRSLKSLEALLQIPGARFLYVPGNHDKYVNAPSCRKALNDAFRKLNGDEISLEDLPVKISVLDCDFILLDETRSTNILSSCGHISKDSVDSVVEWCGQEAKRPKITIGHYPLIEPHPFLRIRKRLWGAKRLTDLLKSSAISISLVGHIHKPYAKLDKSGRGEICAGSLTRNGSFELIEYHKENNVFSKTRIFL